MTGYTRQESYQTGDSILASHTNNELDQLEAAFNAVTGHSHDGTAAEGGPITVIMDTDGDTKIQVEETVDEDIIRFDTLGVEQMTISSAGVVATTGNVTVGGTLSTTGAATLASAAITGAATVGTTLGVTGATTLSASATVGTTLGVTGATTLSSTLAVIGDSTFTGDANFANGAAATPSLTFTSDPDTGIYRLAANTIAFAAAGTYAGSINSSGFYSTGYMYAENELFAGDGTVGVPGIAFNAEQTTGLYRPATNTLAIAVNSISRVEVDPTKVYIKSAPQQFTIWEDTDAALNQKKWRITSTGAQFTFGVTSDDELTSASAWYVNRGTGTTVDDVNISAPFKMFNTAYFQGSAPKYQIYQTGGSLDNKRWDVLASSEQLQFNVVNDAESVSNPWMTVDRTTTTPDLVTMYSGIISENAAPSLGLHDTNSGAHEKIWKFYTDGVDLNLGIYNDLDAFTGDFITFTRSGINPSSIVVQTPLTVVGTLIPQGGIDVSGTGDTVSLNAGTAALPSLIFGSDTDTGLYQPSANRIGFSSFGAEVMSVDDSDFRISHPSNSSFIMTDTGGTLDNKKFQFYVNNGQLSCWLMNDAESVTTKLFEVNRTGTTLNRTDWNKPFALEAGTAALPSLTFQTDLDTGVYLSAANTLSVAAAGANVLDVTTNAMTLSGTAPRIVLVETDASLDNKRWDIRASAEQIDFRILTDDELSAPSWLQVTRTADTVDNVSITSSFMNVFAPLRPDVVSLGNVGTAASPALYFSTDPDTGIYRTGVNTLGFAAGGAVAGQMTSAGIGINNGTGGAPSLHFTSDPDTGLFRVTTNILGITAGASTSCTFAAGGITSQGWVFANDYFSAPDGTVSSPGYQFSNRTTTGWYRTGTDTIGFAFGGTKLLDYNATGLIIETTAATARLILDETDYISGTTVHAEFKEAGVVRGSISSNGTNTAYNTTSDYRLKENVVAIDDAVDCVKRLKPCRFNFIGNDDVTSGFIAHEVQEVVAEAVTGEKDGEEMQQMDAAKLVPILTAALQNALDRIEALEARVN